ncbi:MAG: hypothetical protein WB239_07990, partial [Acidimicrobiia bacterium]
KRMYRARRKRLLEVPSEAMRRRFGPSNVVVDEEEGRSARVTLDGAVIEMGFSGLFRMFGALIDTQWVGVTGDPSDPETVLEFRFDKMSFATKQGSGTALADRLGDARTRRLAERSELKSIRVEDGPGGRRVVVTPLAGTITAVYLPPMPPYSVPIKPEEADDHIDLVLHLLGKA